MRLLWIPHTGWHIPQRAHLFCRPLSERHEVHVTDWVADFASVRDFLSRRYLRNFSYRRYRDGQITVHGIPRISPALFVPALRRLNQAVFSWYVRSIIERHAIDVVVGTFVVPPPQAPRLVFDWFDDNAAYWADYRLRPGYASEIKRSEEVYIQRADAIVVVSSLLRDSAIAQLGVEASDRVHLIPNGVHLARFREVNGAAVRERLNIPDSTRVVGFISALGEFSGLLRLLEAIEQLGASDVVLVVVGDGPLLPLGRRTVEERKIPDVIFTGWVPFSQTPAYYQALDVGVIPFDKSPFTDAACPIKLLEYSAAGVPTVCTDLEEVRRMGFANVVLVEDDARAMAEGIRQALRMPRSRPPQIEQYDIHQLVVQYEAVLNGEEALGCG